MTTFALFIVSVFKNNNVYTPAHTFTQTAIKVQNKVELIFWVIYLNYLNFLFHQK